MRRYGRRVRWRRLLTGLAGAAIGLILNLNPVPLFFGLDVLVGGIAVSTVALLYGPVAGLSAALVAALPSLVLWGHPWGLVLFALQSLWLGYWNRRTRGWVVELDLAFWLLVGAPVGFAAYGWLLSLPLLDVAVVYVKQVVNSLATTAVAGWLVILLPRRWTGVRVEHSLPVHLTTALTLLLLVPIMALLAVVGRARWDDLNREYREHLFAQNQQTQAAISGWVREYQYMVQVAARRSESWNGDVAHLQELLGALAETYPGLHNVYIANAQGTTVAFHPPVNAQGETTIGLNFSDRTYHQEIRATGAPYLSDVFIGRGGFNGPIVVAAHPFLGPNGEFGGFAAAAIRVDRSLSVGVPAGNDLVQVLVDGNGQVISSSGSYEVLQPFRLELAPDAGTLEVGLHQLVPKAGSTLSQWEQAQLVAVARIPHTSWRLYTLAPIQPLKSELFLQYLRLLLAAVAMMAIGGLLMRGLARFLTRPISNLAAIEFVAPNVGDDSRLRALARSGIPEVRHLVRHIRNRAAQLGFLAFYDPLTRLPNRSFLMKRLELLQAQGVQPVSLLYLDLDGFRLINDSMGHEHGDRLLQAAAHRLQTEIAGPFVARLTGDEFAVLLSGCDPAEAEATGERLVNLFNTPIQLEEMEVFVSISVGVASTSVTSPGDLVRCADLARYEAKRRGKGSCVAFTPDMNTRIVDRLSLELDIRQAVEQEQFSLVYQPIVDLKRERVVGLEALLRWEHPVRGPVSPSQFIPLAEETGMIVPIGHWALREACQQVAAWRSSGAVPPDLVVAVNLSAKQFRRLTLHQEVAEVLRATGLPATCLQLEITESAVMENAEYAVRALRELRSLGVRLAVDDFGTGYSSLSYLRCFPLDTLKIDRSFIQNITESQDLRAIVGAVVALADSLHLRVVAEGIETEAQLEEVRGLGASGGQGYLFASPLRPKEVLESLLVRR